MPISFNDDYCTVGSQAHKGCRTLVGRVDAAAVGVAESTKLVKLVVEPTTLNRKPVPSLKLGEVVHAY